MTKRKVLAIVLLVGGFGAFFYLYWDLALIIADLFVGGWLFNKFWQE